jgi:hypothetical protein
VSSGVNSLAAVLLEDFIRPVYVTVRQRPMSDSQATWLSKALGNLVSKKDIKTTKIDGLVNWLIDW